MLLEGSVGSLLALVGLFVTFWLTVRFDRARERERREVEGAVARQERTAERTATVVRHLASMPHGEVPVREVAEWVNAATRELVIFSSLERGHHPHVAGWALACATHLDEDFKKMEAAVRAGGDVSAESDTAYRLAGHVVGSLTMWQAGERADDWFKDRRHTYLKTPKVM